MARSVTMLPNSSPTDPAQIGVTLAVFPLNFAADWRIVEQAPGKVVYTNVKAPVDQPSTIRIAQTVRPNVYAGTGIEPTAQCPTKRGCDTVVELKMVGKVTDSDDPDFVQYLPIRMAFTMNLPVSSDIGSTEVNNLLMALLGAIPAKVNDELFYDGLNDLLHGVVEKQ